MDNNEHHVFDAPPGEFRAALSRYLDEHRDRLRAIASRKIDERTRRVFDSEEVASSVIRRLDNLVQRGRIRARTEEELWALIIRVVENTAISKVRLVQTMHRQLAEDGRYASQLLERLDRLGNDDEATLLVLRMLGSISDAEDRQLLLLRLRGATHGAAAGVLGQSETAVRSRWSRLTKELSRRFEDGAFDGTQ